MDRLDAMAVLLAVADAGSLSGAGRALGIPLTTISRKISDLEGHVGAQLLDRSARKVTLTDAGAAFVSACKAILKDVEDAERTAAGEYKAPRGTVTVGMPAAFARLHFLPVLSEFILAYPEIDVRMVFTEVMEHLHESPMDLGVQIGEAGATGLIATPLGPVRRVVCGSPQYLATRRPPTHPRDLSAHASVTIEGPSSEIIWAFQEASCVLAIPVHSRLSVTTADAAIDAAIAGVGLTQVWSYQVEKLVHYGLLEIVLSAFQLEPVPINLAYKDSDRVPLKLRALVDFTLPRLRERLAAASL